MNSTFASRVMIGFFAAIVLAIGYFGPYSTLLAAKDATQAQIDSINDDIVRASQRAATQRSAKSRRQSVFDDLRHQGVVADRSSIVRSFEDSASKLADQYQLDIGKQSFMRTGTVAATAPMATRVNAPPVGAIAADGEATKAGPANPVYNTVGVSIELVGRADNMVRFIRSLEGLPLVVGTNSYTIIPTTQYKDGRILVHTDLSLNLYYLEPRQIGLTI